jgi:hypothetical protein
MRKLLLSTIILLLFSCSILIFQVSCQKDANAGNNNISSETKLVYIKLNTLTDVYEVYTSNLDGTNNIKVPITVPVGMEMNGDVTITKDGGKLIFELRNIDSSIHDGGSIYTCNIDGTNMTKIIGGTTSDELHFSFNTY